MARIYLSSTHADLVEHRDRVYRTLRRMRHDVVATEDYVARDDRPLDACLEDVADCDLYVGLFAWRYGFVPDRDNPDRVSITELEYRHAGERGIPRLVFLLDPDIPWLPRFMDSQAREGDGGSRIGALRDALAAEQVVSFFGSPEDLAGKVGVAASHQLAAKLGADDGAVPPADLAPELRYREAIEARHATLELAGFKTALRAPIDLEALYVPLHAMLDLRAAGKAEFGGADEAEKRLREADAARDLPLFDAFHEAGQRNRRGLVILGEPGSGKTTHLKRLLLWCLRQGTEGLGLAPDLLPVFLPLRELDDTTKGLDAFIESQLDDPNLGVPAGFGARLLERDRLLLLFDGLDEVADPAERAEVSRWVESVARLRPTCVPVVTCRFAGYGGDARLGPEFLELHLRPLTREQSEDFIRKWYRIVETGLAIDPAAAEAAAREGAEALVTRLQAPDFRAARLVEMTRNPLLLANICLVHRDRGGALPRGRARLYDECVDVLLELWRENKRLDVAVSAEVGRRILQPAALWLHEEDGRTRATADELAPVLEPALAAVKWRSADAAVFLRTVRDESGLLTGWGQTQYGFMHLGFQEYLAACEIRRRALEGDDEVLGRLADRYGQSWWREVVLLLVALGNPSVFAPLMEAVVARRGFTEAPDLLDMVLEDAAEVAEAPFVALLRERPGRSPKQWARQHLAMHVLERLGPRSRSPSSSRCSAAIRRARCRAGSRPGGRSACAGRARWWSRRTAGSIWW